MSNEERASTLFVLMSKLRDTKRKGWYDESIKRFRVESVADHIYGCQMLAYAMYSEFDYAIDINKVILMLAIHEIGETIIGDLTPEDMPSNEKYDYEYNAVMELLNLIPNSSWLKDLFIEFEERKTEEAKFAFQIDKAECDLQARLYEQENCFLDSYPKYEFTQKWVGFDRSRIEFDEHFKDLLEYIMNNEMTISAHGNNPILNVISFYKSTNSLKDIQRTGEKIWNIQKEHYGSIAEHIYSVEMLAIIIYLVYGMKIDIFKVVSLISIHELGEIKIGDIAAILKSETDHKVELQEAIAIASLLTKKDILKELLTELNVKVSVDAIYSKYCDKLAPDITIKLYDQLNLIDLNNQEGNPLLNNPIVKRYLDMNERFSTMWILYGQETYQYPEPFISISNYALNHELSEPYSELLKRKK